MVKCLYKYVHKGHDHATIIVEGNKIHHINDKLSKIEKGMKFKNI